LPHCRAYVVMSEAKYSTMGEGCKGELDGSTGGRDESRPYSCQCYIEALTGGHEMSCPYGSRGQSMETVGPEEVALTSAMRAVTARARA
jgi:hypothetical protein